MLYSLFYHYIDSFKSKRDVLLEKRTALVSLAG